MIKTAITAALLAATSPLSAQIIPPPEKVATLRDAALDHDDYAWDIAEGLTTEVGQRMAGTEAEGRGRDWAVRKLRAMGFANVRVEPFDMPVWVRGAESAEILAPFPQKMAVTALGNSGSTGPAGVTGEIVAFDSVDEFKAAPDSAVRGKIVFVDHRMIPTQDGSGYGQFGTPRRQGPTVASKKGALAIIIRSIGTDHHRNPHTGVQRFADGATPIPAGALSVPDAEQLARILKRGKPVTMHLTLVSQNIGIRQSGNVVAEVPGRDPTAPMLLVGGHLDSWDLGTGAIDNASGLAILTAAAKRIMDAGRPLRTIRVVWFGAEEVGGFGGIAYQKAHPEQRYTIAGESDFGADRIWRFGTKLSATEPATYAALTAALAPLGIVNYDKAEANGTDIGPAVEAGAPWLSLSQDGTRYFDYHHTPDDTLDKIDPAQLRQNVAAWTAALAVLSGGIAEPKRSKRR
ncbi:MAG: M28 family peptidase [Sphingomonas sp.]|uniref:M28 family peptidase n=1 Tax=Sphingomonas sp. TaxID=28214 RepID=UPI0018033B65|nr:M28 family peptidase [Sphingomonas sp.]MBA3668193.1 M28 family peptidase [Sphingomonas sp.]